MFLMPQSLTMNQNLIDNNYIIVPNFISPDKARQLATEFKKYCEDYECSDDPQVPNCSAKYDFPPFIELLVERNQTVCQLVGENVLPTYSYARNYRKGNILPGHVDKPQCEISLTINLECDEVWPIWIYTPSGEKKSVRLHPGDAMLYLGMIGEHGRDPFDGQSCTQVFLHYVRTKGPCFKYYFDKDHRHTDSVIKPKKSVIEPKKTTISGDHMLSTYIKTYDNVFTPDECELILDEYRDCEHWAPAGVSSSNIQNPSVRNCDIISISTPQIINKNRVHRDMIDKMIFKKANAAAQNYIKDFPACFLKSDSGYDLLRYNKGGYYREHTDSFTEQPRTVAMSINLNDDYVGGNMAFFNEEIQIKGGAGSVILFPANFMYPHQIMDVTEGTRYSIVTWFT